MDNSIIISQTSDKTHIADHENLWEDNDFLQKLDQRIKDLETRKVISSTWEDVKRKSQA